MSINTQTTKSGLVYQVDSLLKRSYSVLSTEDLHTLMLMILTLKTLAENNSGSESLESSIVNTMGLANGIQRLSTKLKKIESSLCQQAASTTTNQKLPMEKSSGPGPKSLTTLYKGLERTSCPSHELAYPTDLKEYKE